MALRQLAAFAVDFGIIAFPLVLAPGLDTAGWMLLMWAFYIPTAEYLFARTLGMGLVGTRIMAATDPYSRVSLIAVLRRHVGRISFFWGAFGWLLSLIGTQVFKDYVIIHDGKASHPERIAEEEKDFGRGVRRIWEYFGGLV